LTGKAGFSVKDDREGLPAGELVEVDGLRLTGDESQRAGGHLLPAQAGKAASAAERASSPRAADHREHGV